MIAYIPNLIKQPAANCCDHCGKYYKNISKLRDHMFCCKIITSTKQKSHIVIEEEFEEAPSNKVLYTIILDQQKKINALTKKIEDMNTFFNQQKTILRKKTKLNIIEWLNQNRIPNMPFDNQFINFIEIDYNDVENTIEQDFCNIVDAILNKNIFNKNSDVIYPIFVSNNVKKFYIYNEGNWREAEEILIVKFVGQILSKILKKTTEYKKKNKDKISQDEKLSITWDETALKMYSISIKENSSPYNKIKTNMLSKLKVNVHFE